MIVKNYLIKRIAKKAVFGVVFFLSLTASRHTLAQQNIQFSQYIFNTLSVNPAYAGYKEEWYFQAAHRMQWDGMKGYELNGLKDGGGAPVTTQISVDGVMDEYTKNVGLGAQLTVDKLGIQTATSFYANYAYRIKLDYADMSRLCFGIGVGITQYGTNISRLRYWDSGDPLLEPRADKSSYIPDVRVGAYYYNEKYYVGLSVMNLLSGKDSTSVLKWDTSPTLNIIHKPHLYLMGGALLELTDYTKLRPSIIIREDFKGPTNIDIGTMFVFDNRFWLGASYRTGFQLSKTYKGDSEPLSISNALVGLVNLQISDRFRVGYSYDFSLNSLSTAQKGTHELTVGWFLTGRAKRVLSPRFF